jgi:lipoprotein NlpD
MTWLRESRGRSGASAAVSVCVVCLCLTMLASCTSTTSMPVSRRDARAAVHVVQSGETLSKIAWQHRVDPQELANWNGIGDPDRLRIGQRLRLVPPRGYVAAAPAPVARAPEAARQSTPPKATPRATTPSPSASRSPSTRTPSASTSASPRTPSAPTSSSQASRPPAARPPTTSSSTRSAPRPAARWAWPTAGQVVARFGADGSVGSGIGIGGREGQPVRAAAAGRVVYAGGGLIGYGQLVIIKHDETFLSAYGYNSELLVTQGQDVASGATIALMGQGPGRQPRLHFEIRRNGVPVDPLLFVSAPR